MASQDSSYYQAGKRLLQSFRRGIFVLNYVSSHISPYLAPCGGGEGGISLIGALAFSLGDGRATGLLEQTMYVS